MDKRISVASRIRQAVSDNPNAWAAEIARVLGVSRQRVHQVCRDSGIKLPKAPPSPPFSRANCAAPARISPSVAGAVAEAIAIADLLSRGYKPYSPVVRQRSHDIIAVSPSGVVITIEVRSAVRDVSRVHVPKSARDKSQHYALVLKDEPVVYKPDLPR